MPTAAPNLMYRLFMKGLAGGILVLAVSAWMWLTAATWCVLCARNGLDPFTSASDVEIPMISLAPSLAVAAVLILSALRVRRKAQGLKWSDLKRAGPGYVAWCRIRNRFLWITVVEWLLIALIVLFGVRFHRPDLIWPGVSLVVSAHFMPLAKVFKLPLYHATALSGSLVSLIGLVLPASSITTAYRLLIVSLGVGATMAITAGYAALRSDQLVAVWDIGVPRP